MDKWGKTLKQLFALHRNNWTKDINLWNLKSHLSSCEDQTTKLMTDGTTWNTILTPRDNNNNRVMMLQTLLDVISNMQKWRRLYSWQFHRFFLTNQEADTKPNFAVNINKHQEISSPASNISSSSISISSSFCELSCTRVVVAAFVVAVFSQFVHEPGENTNPPLLWL